MTNQPRFPVHIRFETLAFTAWCPIVRGLKENPGRAIREWDLSIACGLATAAADAKDAARTQKGLTDDDRESTTPCRDR